MAGTRTGHKRLLRDLNQSIIFNLIVEHGAISRTDLARRSQLPAATITRIVGEFLAAGLISEKLAEESSGGRPPVFLSINPNAGYVVGIKLREDGMTIAICDLNCTIIFSADEQITGEAMPHRVVEAMTGAVKRCVSAASVPMNKVLGIGVGLSGLIDSARGICRYSAILGWRDVELAAALEFKLHLPVRIDNDVNTLAVAERYFGAGRDAANFLMLTLGRGIGLGIVIGGEIYRGSSGGAGEFGHMTIDTSADAPVCNCGKRGCLEAIASDYGILKAATGADPGHHVEDAIGTLIERAQQGDEEVRTIFTRAGDALGIALANLTNLFDPARVLIGGKGLRAGELLLEPMRATLPLHRFGAAYESIELVPQTTDDASWARGAASLLLREVFRSPIYEGDEALVIDDLLSQANAGSQRRRKG
ncbi:xylose repressor protein [Ktedonobacter sp. SOSP1-52]|uniref:ROK family transcriptional regulator n=1 Tax=Ktedonobacter sp. SOSP1-52 TaxID=2778366 RepID=UPI00191591FD|nr:ROK family transcriptional regulator [Ktedonobacter sp. SOSP1-52]GHO61645.1 xylose repressor protein [Ktedonobacter sp. SOSP1-52]